MDDYSSTVSLSSSPGNGVQSVYLDESNYESDHVLEDNPSQEGSVSSQAESEEGLFVEQERGESPASSSTFPYSDQEENLQGHFDHESPRSASPLPQELERDLFLLDHDQDLDLDFEYDLGRGFDLPESQDGSSDSEGTVGQDRDESPMPGLFRPHQNIHNLFDGLSEDGSSDIAQGDHWSGDDDLLEAEEAGLLDDDYDDEDEDDANFPEPPEPVPHHHHHLHHHHFHHPRLPVLHADSHSPIVRGINPLQQLGSHYNVNFLPPHLHEHLRRASASPAHPASPHSVPRMDQLVGVELGGPGPGGAGRNHRGLPAQNQPDQARANVIDLTLDDEEVEIVGESQNARRQQSQRRNNAPRLNRSDGSYVGNQVIELSSDSEDEVQINRVNTVNAPPPAVPANHHRHHHHHVHHHHAPHHHHRGAMDRRSPRRMPGANNALIEEHNRGLFNMVGNVFGRMRDRLRDDPVVFLGSSPAPILPVPNIPNMPNIAQIQLDYMAHPFHPPPPPAGAQKPPHVPPSKPRDGFTRDTNDDDVVICPSCDEELAFDPDDDDENGPPLKKARTKRDKAEHHFWCVKECGHVYCKRCYENRKPTVKKPVKVGFKPCPLNSKKILCAVDGCNSDVSSKTAWVGIFL